MSFFVIINSGNGFLINFIDIAIYQVHSKWFYVDLVASFPTSYLSFPSADEYEVTDDIESDGERDEVLGDLNGVNKLLRLVRIIKLARVFRM